MERCLQLAKSGAGFVSPNPLVGAVLVHNETIIGEGNHARYGEAHAEVNCLNSVLPSMKHLVCESTLYVSLEPCNHYGKTPPCCDLIIENKIPRVIVACSDPFEKVNGTGISKLRSAGVTVTVGVLEAEAIELNKRFFLFHKEKRPYVFLKWAQTSDGFIASENYSPLKISNDITDRFVHKMRSEEAAIVIGTNTAAHDNPSLTNRLWTGNNPVRVVLDLQLRLSDKLKIFDGTVPTIVINTLKEKRDGNIQYKMLLPEENVAAGITRILFENSLTSAIIEGGTMLLQTFIDAGLWDEALVITNQSFNQYEGIEAPSLTFARYIKTMSVGPDLIAIYKRTPN